MKADTLKANQAYKGLIHEYNENIRTITSLTARNNAISQVIEQVGKLSRTQNFIVPADKTTSESRTVVHQGLSKNIVKVLSHTAMALHIRDITERIFGVPIQHADVVVVSKTCSALSLKGKILRTSKGRYMRVKTFTGESVVTIDKSEDDTTAHIGADTHVKRVM